MNKCHDLGDEWTFSQLLNCSDWNTVKTRIAAIQPKTMLDLGCGDALSLFLSYHLFGITHLEGVDNEGEDVLTGRVNEVCKGSYRSRYDALVSRWRPCRTDVIQTRMDHNAYAEHMHLIHAPAQHHEFLLKSYDIIVMSNLLHYLNDRDCLLLLKRVRSLLRTGGIFYLRFKQRLEYGSYKPGFSYNQLVTMCREELKDLNLKERIRTSEHGEDYVLTNL